MADPKIKYHEPSDTLYITFVPGESGAGLGLSDHILLRANLDQRKALSLMLLDFSVLASRDEQGPFTIPLSGLDELPPKAREVALELLHSRPVSEFLSVTSCPPSSVIPIVAVNADKLIARAA